MEVTLKNAQIKKLVSIEDQENLLKLLQTLTDCADSECIISINQKTAVWNKKNILCFDVDRCGNAQYNLVGVLRDLLNEHFPKPKNWTHKNTLSKISWGPCS